MNQPYIVTRAAWLAKVWWPPPYRGTIEAPPEPPTGPVLIDSWPVENQNDIGSYGIRDTVNQPYQAFTAPRDAQLKSIKLSLKRFGNPVGEILVALRDASGAYPNAVPGGRIAGTKKLDVSTIGTAINGDLYQFDFLAAQPLISGQQYAVVLEKFNDGTTTFPTTDYLLAGFTFTFDASPHHYGNGGFYQGTFQADAAADMIFYLYE